MKIKIKYPACPVAPEDGTGVNPACPPGGLILSKKTETYKLMNVPKIFARFSFV
jgi:hypothetical protein